LSGTAGKVLKSHSLPFCPSALQAFLASTGEHTLSIHGSSRRIQLQHVRWELLQDQGQPEPAGGTTAGAAAPAAPAAPAATTQPSVGSSAQQHKRKQPLPNARSTRARLQDPEQPQQAASISAASDAAGAPAAAEAGEGGNASRSTAQPGLSSQAGTAAKPSTRGSKAAAGAGQGTCNSSPKRQRRAVVVNGLGGSGTEAEPSQGLPEAAAAAAAAGQYAGPTLAPAAAAATVRGAPPGPVKCRPQRRIQPTVVQPSPAAASDATAATRQQEDDHLCKQDAAKSVAGSQHKALLQADVDAEAVVKRAADRAAKPSSTEEAIGAGQGRPQRNRQPSKRLVLPGEEQHDTHSTQQQQPAAGNSMLKDTARPVKASAVQPGPYDPAWPTDQQLRAAVAAAQVSCVAAGKGELRWQLPGGTNRALGVQLEDFVLGNPLSCHTASQQGPVDAPKLFQQVGGLQRSMHARLGVKWCFPASTATT